MPYRISKLGLSQVWSFHESGWPKSLTDWQKELLVYLYTQYETNNKGFIPVSDIAYKIKLHPRAVTGVGHSLVVKGLIEKPKNE